MELVSFTEYNRAGICDLGHMGFESLFSSNANAEYGTFKSVLWYRVVGDQVEWSRRRKGNGRARLVSSVNFIKGPRVSETAIPHLVHHLCCVSLVAAGRACPYGENRPPSHTFLMLLSEFPLASAEELSRPSAFAAQGASADLIESRVSERSREGN